MYTLVLIKFIYQALVADRWSMLVVSVVAVVGAIFYNMCGLDWSWSVTNVMLALPFFMLGNWLASYGNSWFNNIIVARGKSAPFLLLSMAVVGVIGHYNGSATMFQCQYGNSFFLFVVGALFGSYMIFIISLMLDKFDWVGARIISMGTIVILVFHRELLHECLKMIKKADFGIVTENIAIFFLALAVLLAFIPILLIVKRLLPIVLGNRVKSV